MSKINKNLIKCQIKFKKMSYFFKPIADRIRRSVEKSFVNDSELARELGVSRQSLESWKKRNRIPVERVVNYCINRDLNLLYILTGEERKENSSNNLTEREEEMIYKKYAESLEQQVSLMREKMEFLERELKEKSSQKKYGDGA